MNKQLYKWKWSREYWKITLTHELGSIIEKEGRDYDQMKKEIKISAIEMDRQIEETLKIRRK